MLPAALHALDDRDARPGRARGEDDRLADRTRADDDRGVALAQPLRRTIWRPMLTGSTKAASCGSASPTG